MKKYLGTDKGKMAMKAATKNYITTSCGRVADKLKKLRMRLRQKEKVEEKDMFGEEPKSDDTENMEGDGITIQILDGLGNNAVLAEIRSYNVSL